MAQPNGDGPAEPALTVKEDNDFEELLDYLKRHRGFDITGYKRASLIRRVAARMRASKSIPLPTISTSSRSIRRSSPPSSTRSHQRHGVLP